MTFLPNTLAGFLPIHHHALFDPATGATYFLDTRGIDAEGRPLLRPDDEAVEWAERAMAIFAAKPDPDQLDDDEKQHLGFPLWPGSLHAPDVRTYRDRYAATVEDARHLLAKAAAWKAAAAYQWRVLHPGVATSNTHDFGAAHSDLDAAVAWLGRVLDRPVVPTRVAAGVATGGAAEDRYGPTVSFNGEAVEYLYYVLRPGIVVGLTLTDGNRFDVELDTSEGPWFGADDLFVVRGRRWDEDTDGPAGPVVDWPLGVIANVHIL